MRKALHQISAPFTDLGEASDGLEALAQMPGVEAAWICREQRVHFVTTDVKDLESLTAADLQPGQRLVYLPAKRPAVAQAA